MDIEKSDETHSSSKRPKYITTSIVNNSKEEVLPSTSGLEEEEDSSSNPVYDTCSENITTDESLANLEAEVLPAIDNRFNDQSSSADDLSSSSSSDDEYANFVDLDVDPEGHDDGEDDDDDDDLLDFSLSTRHKTFPSDMVEDDPYIAPPPPINSWRAFPLIHRRSCGVDKTPFVFSRSVQRSCHFIRRWKRLAELHHHKGCVNGVNFNMNGKLLASGSDDLQIAIWDWAREKKLLHYNAGHHSNIFQSKFLPHTNDSSIISCARDGQVRCASISSYGGFHGTVKYAQHSSSANRLAVLYDSPCQFLSAGEDGVVFHIDIRSKPSDSASVLLKACNDKKRPIDLYSIYVNPKNENLFVISGRDSIVRIYDRRAINERKAPPIQKLQPESLPENGQFTVTCVVYSNDGKEIVASYNDGDIYVFDVCESTKKLETKTFSGHRNNATVKSVNFYGPNSEFVVSGSDDGYVYVWDKESTKIIQWLDADAGGVVNVLEPHPDIPVMATSGLDKTIKIWSPNSPTYPTLKGLATTIKQNIASREEDLRDLPASVEIPDQMFLFCMEMLQNRIRLRPGVTSDSSPNDSDTDDPGSHDRYSQCRTS